MLHIVKDESESLHRCAEIYVQAYREEPWQEEYDISAVKTYIEKFITAETRSCFILKEENVVIGLALCVIMPCVDSDYLRIEDICITPDKQKCGAGSAFLKLISGELRALRCDSLLLGTQKDFPAHKFYVKNGFEEIENSVLLFYEPAETDGQKQI